MIEKKLKYPDNKNKYDIYLSNVQFLSSIPMGNHISKFL